MLEGRNIVQYIPSDSIDYKDCNAGLVIDLQSIYIGCLVYKVEHPPLRQ